MHALGSQGRLPRKLCGNRGRLTWSLLVPRAGCPGPFWQSGHAVLCPFQDPWQAALPWFLLGPWAGWLLCPGLFQELGLAATPLSWLLPKAGCPMYFLVIRAGCPTYLLVIRADYPGYYLLIRAGCPTYFSYQGRLPYILQLSGQTALHTFQ